LRLAASRLGPDCPGAKKNPAWLEAGFPFRANNFVDRAKNLYSPGSAWGTGVLSCGKVTSDLLSDPREVDPEFLD
jgi:hypothetical protein